MNTLAKFIILAVLHVSFSWSQEHTAYEKGMTKAFELLQANQLDAAEPLFERIANVEDSSWLPHYYVAFINSMKSWDLKDEVLLKSQLDKAQTHLDAAFKKSENNAELLVMQAYVYTNWVAYDGMTYGMKYSPRITELYQKAYAFAPQNPRVLFGKAEWDMGSAKFFGKDTTPFCKDIEKALELFANFKPETAYSPNWGEDRAKQVLEQCHK